MKRIRLADAAAGLAGLLAAAASIWAMPGIGGVLGAGLALLMLAIAAVDYRHLIIPDELTAAAVVLAVVNAAAVGPSPIVDGLAAAALRGTVTMLLFWSLRCGSIGGSAGGRAWALGHVKLAFVAGAWLDWTMIPVAIEIAALGALTAYGVWRSAGRPIDATSRLPFGLFFAPAIWLAWLAGAVLFAL